LSAVPTAVYLLCNLKASDCFKESFMDNTNTLYTFEKAPVSHAVLKNSIPAMAAMLSRCSRTLMAEDEQKI